MCFNAIIKRIFHNLRNYLFSYIIYNNVYNILYMYLTYHSSLQGIGLPKSSPNIQSLSDVILSIYSKEYYIASLWPIRVYYWTHLSKSFRKISQTASNPHPASAGDLTQIIGPTSRGQVRCLVHGLCPRTLQLKRSWFISF